MRILLVEDDAMLAETVARALRQSAHTVETAARGDQADELLQHGDYDLVLLDAGLPGIDGFEVLRRLRRRRNAVPVLILTARDEPADRVAGLDLGADDYLTKPFHLSELEARVRALIRRSHASGSPELAHGPLRLDAAARRLFCNGKPLEVSARELAVLELLLLREGRVVTKQSITDRLYGWDEPLSSNAVDVFVHRLRKKLQPSGVDIRTVRGMGYLVDKPNADKPDAAGEQR